MKPARGTAQSLEGSPPVVDLFPSPTLYVHAAVRDLQLHRTEIHITIKPGD